MSNKKGKLPPIKRSATAQPLVMRMVDATAPQRAVIATENPVPKYMEELGEVVSEVLLMEGAEFRGGRNQTPIVDSHDDSSVRNIYGSIQRIQVDQTTGEMYGVPMFASDQEAQRIKTRLDEGHITDFSITADPLESVYIPVGRSFTTPRGNVIEGPAVIHKRWQVLNASICATGADEYSTVRRSYTSDLNKYRRVKRMDETLIAQLAEMGLPDGMTDPNQVLAWVVGKLKPDPAEEAPVVESMEETAPPQADMESPVENMDGEEQKPPAEESVARSKEKTVDLIKRALANDQKRRNEIQAACKLAKIERTFADELCDAGVSVEVANKRIIERMATQPLGTSVDADVRVTESGDDKLYGAMRDGLITRSLASTTLKNRKLEKPAHGYRDFSAMPVRRMAAIVVRNSLGISHDAMDRLSEVETMRLAMGNPQAIRRHRAIIRRDVSAYNTTGTFGNLLLDAINKTLLTAYEEAEYSFSVWARQGASVDTFHDIHRTRFSEFPNLEAIPENDAYPQKQMSDAKESYRVTKYGATLMFSWESFIKDDLDAFSKGPVMMGNAALRTLNQKVYGVLTANDTMGDGNALFSASHASGSNTSGAAAAPSVTTLNAGFLAMRKQKGLNSDVAINVSPRFLIHGPAYEATVDELLVSTSYNAANNNEGVKNLYGPDGPTKRRLVPVCDNALGDTNTNWFLAADPAQGVDTVEYTFLAGEESPMIDQEEDFDTDTYKFKIRQTFGVKAIDWRGLYRNSA